MAVLMLYDITPVEKKNNKKTFNMSSIILMAFLSFIFFCAYWNQLDALQSSPEIR